MPDRFDKLAKRIAGVTGGKSESIRIKLELDKRDDPDITNTQLFHRYADNQSPENKQDTHIKRQK